MTSKPIDKSAAQLAFVRNEIFSREPSEKDLHKVGRSNSNENLSLRPKIMDKGTRTANSSFVDLSSMASGLGDMNRYEMRIIKDSSHSITSRNGSRLSLAASKVSLIDSRRGSGAKTPSPKGSAIALNSLNFSLTAKNFSLAVAAARGELPTVTSKSNQNLDKSLGASLFQQSLGKPASNGVSPVPGGRRETVTNPYDDGHFNALRKVYKLAIHDFRILKIKMKPNQQDFNAVLKDDKCRDIADAVKIFSVKKLDKSDIETQKAIDKLIELKLDASRIRHVFCTSLVSILQDASSIYCVFDSNNYTLEDVLMTQNVR